MFLVASFVDIVAPTGIGLGSCETSAYLRTVLRSPFVIAAMTFPALAWL